LEEDHVPPEFPFDESVVVPGKQIVEDPLIVPAFAAGVTVIVIVSVSDPEHGAGEFTEYVISDVPALTPVTTPEAFTVATAGLEEDHVPPGFPFDEIVVVFP
jgi:hypothetical protein